MELVLADRFGKLQAQIDSVTTVVGPTAEQLESRMRELELALARALSLSQDQPPPGISIPEPSDGNTDSAATRFTESSGARSMGPLCRKTPLPHIAKTTCTRGPATATTL